MNTSRIPRIHFMAKNNFFIYYVYSDMYTNFSFIKTQSSPGEEKRKQIKKKNFKSTNGSHSFGNNFCHKPKGYKLKADRGERYWNNN